MTDPNVNIAWTRTTFTSLWTGLVLWLAAKFGWQLDVESPTTIVVVGLSGAVVWRLSELLAQVPYLGYVLFGVNKAPGYDQPTPPNPAVEAEPPVDAGRITLGEIVLGLAAVALVIWIVGAVR